MIRTKYNMCELWSQGYSTGLVNTRSVVQTPVMLGRAFSCN